MKQLIFILIAFSIPGTGLAKITNFNQLIAENTKAQKELQRIIQKQVQEARTTVTQAASPEPLILSDHLEGKNEVAAAMAQEKIAFKRERSVHRVSEKEHLDRLAHEFSQTDE